MAQLVIAAAGAAVGFAVAGPAGAKWGWIAGSLVGAAFSPAQKSQGTRLSDLTVGGSSYGTPLPYVQGHPRIAGSVIWASEKRELATTSSSGKGGNAEHTTYTYEVDLLIELTDNPGFDVTRIWDNGKLIYNILPDASVTTLDANDNTDTWSRMTVYSGASTQLPDPDYEAAVGVGSAPAYRGRCTVFIKSLGLGTSGIIPNLTFEITPGTGPHPPPVYVGAIQPVSLYGDGIAMVDPTTGWVWTVNEDTPSNTLSVTVTSDAAQVVIATMTPTWTTSTFTSASVVYVGNGEVWVMCVPYVLYSRYPLIFRFSSGNAQSNGTANVEPAFIDTFLITLWEDGTGAGIPIDPRAMGFDASTGRVWVAHSFNNVSNATVASINPLTQRFISKIDLGAAMGTPYQIMAVSPYVAAAGWGGGSGNFALFDSVAGTVTAQLSLTGLDATSTGKQFDYDPVRQKFVFGADPHYVVDAATGSFITRTLTIAPDVDTVPPVRTVITPIAMTYHPLVDRYIFGQANDQTVGGYGTALFIVNPDTGVTEKTLSYESGASKLMVNPLLAPFPARNYVLSFDQTQVKRLYLYGNDVSDVTLEEVVTAVCLRSGMAAADFDATPLAAITLPVHAMAISTVSTARNTLDMLASAYFFTAVASDKLYFRPRGQTAAATLVFDDLGAAVMGSAVPESLPLSASNDLEVPSQIALTYSNVDGDYQTDTQNSDRLLTDQINVSALQLPLGFTPVEAKAIADQIVMDGAVGALTTTFTLNRIYERLEPSDVVIATGQDGSTYRLRLTRRSESDGVLKFDAVLDDVSVLTQSGITSTGIAAQTSVAPIQSTTLALLDIPLLRDADNQPGYYYAVEGEATGWRGAALYTSADALVYTNTDQTATAEVIGVTTTALPSTTATDAFDEIGTVTVNIGAVGDLVSVSRDEILANSLTNAAYIGSAGGGGEIVQFRVATLVSAGVYWLSGLLRGRRGTEAAIGSHVIGDRFVLLGGGTQFLPAQTSDLGRLRYHKAVTAGQRLSAVAAQTLTLSGVGLKPFSPVNVRANRDAADTVITWTRRTRLSTRLTGTLPLSAPLGEASEAYEVEIFATSAFATLKRTLSASTPTVTYTSAQQVTDFGSAQTTLYVRVYQLSAIVGRGFPVSATV